MLEQQIMHHIFALEKLSQVIWTICKLGQNVGQERSKGHETFELAKIWKLLICHSFDPLKFFFWGGRTPQKILKPDLDTRSHGLFLE